MTLLASSGRACTFIIRHCDESKEASLLHEIIPYVTWIFFLWAFLEFVACLLGQADRSGVRFRVHILISCYYSFILVLFIVLDPV